MARGEGSGKTFSNQFKLGCVETVLSRLEKADEDMKAEYAGTAALVLVNNQLAEVEKYITQTVGPLKRMSPTIARADASARELGRKAGESVSLNKAVSSASSKAPLLS
jgi:hypothetical protein